MIIMTLTGRLADLIYLQADRVVRTCGVWYLNHTVAV